MTRFFYLMTLVAGSVFAQSPSVTCGSGPNAVQEGQSITCSSNMPVVWSLAGVGSLSNQTTTSVTYTAPASITAQHVVAGWPVMPNDAVFNTRIDSLPVNPNSSVWINGVSQTSSIVASGLSLGHCPIGASSPPSYCYLSFVPGWGLSTATSNNPSIEVLDYYGGRTMNFPLPQGEMDKRQAGSYRPGDNQDHHYIIAETDTGEFFEAYNLHHVTVAGGNGCSASSGNGSGCNAQSSIGFHWYDYGVNGAGFGGSGSGGLGGTNASAVPWLPITAFLSELYSGQINHAIGVNLCSACTYGAAGTGLDMNQGTATLAGTQYIPVYGYNVGPSIIVTSESSAQAPALQSTMANVNFKISPAPGAGNSVSFQFRDNGANLGSSCMISGSATSCSIASAGATAAGDNIDWQLITSGSVSVNNIYITSNYGITQMWPAGSPNYSGGGPQSPPIGARMRLRICGRNGVTSNCQTLDSNPYKAALENALNYYGAILVDSQESSIGFLASLGRDVALDRSVWNAISNWGMYVGNFEFVDESSLELSPSSFAVCPFNVTGACAGGLTNGYEQPNGQAVVSATANGQTTYIPIAIEGVTMRIGAW